MHCADELAICLVDFNRHMCIYIDIYIYYIYIYIGIHEGHGVGQGNWGGRMLLEFCLRKNNVYKIYGLER